FQGLIILVISLFAVGVTTTIQGFFIALLFMLLVAISFTALGIAIASRIEDMHGFQLIMNFVIFPIFGLSGALFPLTSAPPMLRTIAYLDPLAYGVEGIRYGLLGVSQINPITCFAVLAGFSIIMIFIGGYLFKKIKV
ncbi:MAG: ABC transporter permease, partial [Nanoarchaeota archaeon]|nr:ABC transporter permease [Nanoarchaeota archaeon]